MRKLLFILFFSVSNLYAVSDVDWSTYNPFTGRFDAVGTSSVYITYSTTTYNLVISTPVSVSSLTITGQYTFPAARGSDNQIMKMNGTVVGWEADATGAGGVAAVDISIDATPLVDPIDSVDFIGTFNGFANGTTAQIWLSTGAVTNGTVTTVPNSDQVYDFGFSNVFDFTSLADIMTLDADTTFNTGSSSFTFRVNNPQSGAVDISGAGAYAGDLLHIHQHTGNAGAGNIIHAESEDMDITPLVHITQDAANITADVVGLLIDAVDDDDGNFIPIEIRDDADTNNDLLFRINSDGSVDGSSMTMTGAVEVGAALTITEGAITNSMVVSADIKDGELVVADLTAATTGWFVDWANQADVRVTSAQITDATIVAGDLTAATTGWFVDWDNAADVRVTSSQITDGTIESADYANGSIDLDDLAAGVYAKDLVTTAPLTGAADNIFVGADSDVTLAIAADGIDSVHYAAVSIDNEHLANNAVDSDELAAASVDVAHLAAATTGYLTDWDNMADVPQRLQVSSFDYGMAISSPVFLGTSIGVRIAPYFNYATTLTTVTAICSDGTSVTFNLDQRPYSVTANPYDTEGTLIWSAACVAGTAGYIGAAVSDFTIPANYGLFLSSTAFAVSGDVGRVDIHVEYTID